MTVHIKRSANSEINCGNLTSVVHYMPCQIHADGEANISKYFKPYIKKISDTDENLIASFRGHPLEGKVMQLPEGYRGVVLQEAVKSSLGGEERSMHIAHCFKSFTYWNWDKSPSKNDALLAAFDWIDISHALHSSNDT